MFCGREIGALCVVALSGCAIEQSFGRIGYAGRDGNPVKGEHVASRSCGDPLQAPVGTRIAQIDDAIRVLSPHDATIRNAIVGIGVGCVAIEGEVGGYERQ